MVQKAEEQHLDADVEVPAHKRWKAEDEQVWRWKQINDWLNLERVRSSLARV